MLVTLLAVSGMSAALSTQASAAEKKPSASATGVVNSASTKSLLDFWTDERMRAATPEPLPALPAGKQAPEQVENVLPGLASEGSLPTRKVSGPTGPKAGLLAGSRAERWGRQGSMPAITIGKIYYTRNNGTPGYCSGSVINGSNKNTVWTAGHCIHAGGGGAANWFRDFVFVPDADNGREPWGRWTWRYANTTNGWFNDRNWSYDIAAIAFNPQSQRGNLQDWVGSQGYKFNQGQAWTGINAFGFPQDGFNRTDMTGNDLWYCFGNTTRAGAFDDRMHMNCDMFHGSSGGPWLQDLQLSRGWGYIIGANSHRDVDGNQNPVNIVYKSPYHGDGAINVYNDVSVR
ncbi:trypsin-like serine peptidase [Nonomuraea purpurea]|uniref:Trypsin-like serine peptidase n=1 Tax=Nonomuraea purpurea TaxID=1849276 RepID=A0ABV8GC60_9ACTN